MFAAVLVLALQFPERMQLERTGANTLPGF